MYQVENFRERKRWLSSRGLGGSDCPTVLGMNPWKTPLELWAERTGKIPQPELASMPMKVGSTIEPLILEELQERIPERLWRPGERKGETVQCRSRERQWQTYTPDALLLAGKRPGWREVCGAVEAKWVGGRSAASWTSRASDGAMRAEAQLQHGFSVMGLDGGYTCALVGGESFEFYEVERDDDVVDVVVEQESAFMEHVKADIPPDSVFTQQSERVLGQVMPYARVRHVLLDHPELVRDVEQMLEAQATAKRYYAQFAELRGHLKSAALTYAELGEVQSDSPLKIEVPGVGVWSWKLVDVKGYVVEPKQREDFRKVKGT